MNNKLYICGITQNKLELIKKIVEVSKEYVDGFVWTDHFSTDGTYEYLEQNKGYGKIYQFNYTRDHDLSANIWLRSGHIKEGDWCWILDSSDLPNPIFLKELRENIKYWKKNGVGLVYGDRPWLFEWNDYAYFVNSPHWGLIGTHGQTVNLSQINGWRKENYLFNTRDTLQSGFVHPARYWLEFGRSNHTVLLYSQFGQNVYQHHETIRQQFRFFCKNHLNINPLTLDSFVSYLQNNVNNYPKYVEEIIEHEICVKDLFRLFVLKQDWKELDGPGRRFDWSYYHWKKTGEIIQDPSRTGYTGIFNEYKIQKGEKPE